MLQMTLFLSPFCDVAFELFSLWGMNLVAAEGEMWRKHRRIMGPAFNNNL
jgi:cytochrome P450